MITVFVEQEREDSLLQSVGPLVGASVHEQVLAPRVAVDVAVEEDVTTLQRLPHHHLGGAVLWELLHAGRDPLSVEVHAAQGSSVVSDDDAVGVEHRDDLEDEVVSEVLCHLIVRYKELKDALDDEGGIAFSRMHSRSDDYGSTNGDLLGPRAEVRNDGHLAVVTSDGLANDRLPDAVLAVWRAQSLKQLGAVRVRVRVAVGHEHLVVVVFELHLESKSIVEATALLLELVLEVANILAVSVPSVS